MAVMFPTISEFRTLRASESNPLDAIFAPRSVALIGASESPGSVGRAILKNLQTFDGLVYPVCLKSYTVLGLPTFASIAAVPDKVDLAIIATPAPTVPGIIRECAQAHIKGAIVISAGFRECGPEGRKLEEQVVHEARRGGIRLIGPNCLGVMRPRSFFNATFAASLARPGHIAFLSQSGALCTAILDWSIRENVGFSAFTSVGSMADVGWGELIFYFGDDPHTKSIIIYMETIGDAHSFLSAAREVALQKPVIVIKVGRTEAAAQAAASHTGSMTGSDEVLDAAFRRAGVLRVDNIEELFDMAEVLSKQPTPHGPRLAVLTNAGGPGALAADALVRSGGVAARVSAETRQGLEKILPPAWSHGNPVDILGDAGADRYQQALQLLLKDPENDGVLVVLTPQAMTDPTGTARKVVELAPSARKPILASWMGASAIQRGESLLNKAGIPTFHYPDRAARAFEYLWRYSSNLRDLYETPSPVQALENADDSRFHARTIIKLASEAGRTLLTEVEAKEILTQYRIPVVPTRLAHTQEEAVAHARELGYPVVLKLCSFTVSHKAKAGGVHLNLENDREVQAAWKKIQAAAKNAGDFLGASVQPMVRSPGIELILGSSVDAQFGPVLLFGAGGALVEVLRDRAIGLPPLNRTLARRLMEQTKVFSALRAEHGFSSATAAQIEEILVGFSALVMDQTWIKEMDINPILVTPQSILALDARIILHPPKLNPDHLPKPAIRPYPVEYVTHCQTSKGDPIIIRPIRPEDEPLMVKFHQGLSDQSVYYRFFSPLKLEERIRHERLTRNCFIDYDREIALVAQTDGTKIAREVVGVARLRRSRSSDQAEFALLVADAWQNRGLGTKLLTTLVAIARREKIKRITGNILPENHHMKSVAQRAGFKLRPAGEGDLVAEMTFK